MVVARLAFWLTALYVFCAIGFASEEQVSVLAVKETTLGDFLRIDSAPEFDFSGSIPGQDYGAELLASVVIGAKSFQGIRSKAVAFAVYGKSESQNLGFERSDGTLGQGFLVYVLCEVTEQALKSGCEQQLRIKAVYSAPTAISYSNSSRIIVRALPIKSEKEIQTLRENSATRKSLVLGFDSSLISGDGTLADSENVLPSRVFQETSPGGSGEAQGRKDGADGNAVQEAPVIRGNYYPQGTAAASPHGSEDPFAPEKSDYTLLLLAVGLLIGMAFFSFLYYFHSGRKRNSIKRGKIPEE